MGYQVGEHCYATKLQAAHVQRWSLGHDSSVVINGQPHLVQYALTDGETLGYTVYDMSTQTQIVSSTLIYDPPVCEVLGIADGLQIGWMVAGVWLAAFAVLFIAKALRGDSGETHVVGS